MNDRTEIKTTADVTLCSIGYRASQIHANAIAAYWQTHNNGSAAEYLRRLVNEDLATLADLCGYRLEPKQ